MIRWKKSLLALISAAAAFSAQAGEISLYGSVSSGLVYQNTPSLKGGGEEPTRSKNSVSMESGFWGDSIWGITGEEKLGNGWTVGFALENEFASDTGRFADEGRIFDSQAYLRIGNDTFNIAFGSIGALTGAGGDFDLLCGFDPMEGFVGVAGLGAFASKDFASANMFVVETMPIQGLKISAMASFGDDRQDSEKARWSDRNHYYGLGAIYENGSLSLAAAAEMRRYDKQADWTRNDDAWTWTVAAAYDFGVVRPSLVYQHVDKTREFGSEALEGVYNFDSFLLGVSSELGQGTLRASLQYVKGKNEESSAEEGNATILGLAYTYDLSKRTQLYCAGYYAVGGDGLDKKLGVDDVSFKAMNRADYNGTGLGFGLVHAF